MNLLYDFKLMAGGLQPFHEVWDRAWAFANNQQNFEIKCGGEDWPEWKIRLIDVKTSEVSHLVEYHFHAHPKHEV